jgi:hypothetical protein
MKEKVKVPGDHRTISNPIPERKDFIEQIKKNVANEEKDLKKSKSDQKK